MSRSSFLSQRFGFAALVAAWLALMPTGSRCASGVICGLLVGGVCSEETVCADPATTPAGCCAAGSACQRPVPDAGKSPASESALSSDCCCQSDGGTCGSGCCCDAGTPQPPTSPRTYERTASPRAFGPSASFTLSPLVMRGGPQESTALRILSGGISLQRLHCSWQC
jgi:hypothetical protein